MSNRMFRRNLTVRALLLVSAILLSSVLLAQNDTAVLSGRVLDPSGLGVPGAHVRLTKQSTGAIRETLTAIDGAYRVELIEPGDYSSCSPRILPPSASAENRARASSRFCTALPCSASTTPSMKPSSAISTAEIGRA